MSGLRALAVLCFAHRPLRRSQSLQASCSLLAVMYDKYTRSSRAHLPCNSSNVYKFSHIENINTNLCSCFLLSRLVLQRLLNFVSIVCNGRVPVRDTNKGLCVCKANFKSTVVHKEKAHRLARFFIVVRSPRLELGRVHHTPLKRTRLPIPP